MHALRLSSFVHGPPPIPGEPFEMLGPLLTMGHVADELFLEVRDVLSVSRHCEKGHGKSKRMDDMDDLRQSVET
jgi:hypothetical protein